ncbi:MAG: 50S ribosomal protein L4 [Candidatus Buchananbacteria bacterium]
MIKATVYNTIGEKVKELDLNPAIFGLKVKPELVAQAVIAQQANSRQNLAHTKNKGEVRGGGKKPWKQKGTGRARHGSIRSPLWRGGGITFGPRNDQNFSLKINKKAKKKALLMALSDKALNEKIILVDKLELAEAKTKKFYELLKNLNLRDKKKKTLKKDDKAEVKAKKPKSVLLVLAKKDEKITRAARNIAAVTYISASGLNIVDVIKNKYLLMPTDAIAEIEKAYLIK